MQNMEIPQKMLFIRVDRIGDLILTLPVDEIPQLKETHITWCIASGLEFIMESSSKARRYKAISPKFSLAQIFKIWQWLKKEKFEMAIVFHAPWWVSMLVWLAQIPIRAGRQSQWHSYLFLNRGVRQSRSHSEFHESEYNFLLLEKSLKLSTQNRPYLKLEGKNFTSIATQYGLKEKQYVVIHPGMGGSARNVSTSFYIQLIKNLSLTHLVAITGTGSDLKYIDPIYKTLKDNPNIIWLHEKLNGLELISLLQNAKGVIAPSTGVIHLAASTGTQVIGLYSPVRTQHPSRWGPRGSQVQVLLPQVNCPGLRDCFYQACPFYDCMDQLNLLDIQL